MSTYHNAYYTFVTRKPYDFASRLYSVVRQCFISYYKPIFLFYYYYYFFGGGGGGGGGRAIHSTKISRNSSKESKGTEIFRKISKTAALPNCEPFNGNFRIFQEKTQMKLKFSGRFFQNLGIPREVSSLPKIPVKPKITVSFYG